MATAPPHPSPAAAGASAPAPPRVAGGGDALAVCKALTAVEGQHDHTVDDKGRVSIPAEFRVTLGLEEGTELVTARHLQERCLYVFTLPGWENFKVRADLIPDLAVRKAIERVVIGTARRVKVDRLGRVQVPQVQREYAGLDGKCFVMGQGRHMEIWDTQHWDATHGPERYADVDLSAYDI